jgi:hypothetical protein
MEDLNYILSPDQNPQFSLFNCNIIGSLALNLGGNNFFYAYMPILEEFKIIYFLLYAQEITSFCLSLFQIRFNLNIRKQNAMSLFLKLFRKVLLCLGVTTLLMITLLINQRINSNESIFFSFF